MTDDNAYRFKNIALTPGIIEQLIIELFSGKMANRQAIAKDIYRFHLAHGGKDHSSSDLMASVKKALTRLKQKGLAENIHRQWKITYSNNTLDTEELIEIEETDDSYESNYIEEFDALPEGIDVDIIIGSGSAAVYLYYLPIYRQMAEQNGKCVWHCKIGRTNGEPLVRIISQAGTALPEKPCIALIVKTRYSGHLERALHSILTIRGQRVEDAPGAEWFLTSPDEVLSLVKFIDPSLSDSDISFDNSFGLMNDRS